MSLLCLRVARRLFQSRNLDHVSHAFTYNPSSKSTRPACGRAIDWHRHGPHSDTASTSGADAGVRRRIRGKRTPPRTAASNERANSGHDDASNLPNHGEPVTTERGRTAMYWRGALYTIKRVSETRTVLVVGVCGGWGPIRRFTILGHPGKRFIAGHLTLLVHPAAWLAAGHRGGARTVLVGRRWNLARAPV